MDNPRLLLFIALSFVLFMLWQAWLQDYGPSQAPPKRAVFDERGDASATPLDAPLDLPAEPEARGAISRGAIFRGAIFRGAISRGQAWLTSKSQVCMERLFWTMYGRQSGEKGVMSHV